MECLEVREVSQRLQLTTVGAVSHHEVHVRLPPSVDLVQAAVRTRTERCPRAADARAGEVLGTSRTKSVKEFCMMSGLALIGQFGQWKTDCIRRW